MKKLVILIITLAFLTPLFAWSATPKKNKVGYLDITYETKDHFVIKSKLFYPAQKKTVYPMVVMLHSLGYASSYWMPLPKQLVDSGVAVLLIDLRGHGASLYDSNFKIKSWRYYNNETFKKYPEDVLEILRYVAMTYKDISVSDYVIVGADIGANTSILVSEKLYNKPKGLVLISPSQNFKGLYTPLSLANLGSIPIMAVASKSDRYSYSEALTLKKFAQAQYDLKVYPRGGTGMLMIKANPSMSSDISKWILNLLK